MPVIKEIKKNKIILDTHILIWTMTGHSMLKKHFRDSLKVALLEQRVLVSPMSVWEIGMLVEKKRLSLDMDPMEWVDQALDSAGINICELTPKIAIQSTRLAGEVHGDPVDRILMASAQEQNAALVTCDNKILEYGKGKLLTVHDPTK
ncbi:MAG: type II toxin-antitoxin system VapC family toxin [Candidatus Algichlamydia australiensis]|nr:type II toxin-antitoxin system VapC family toxin [Chlamydiales bacterium]